MLFVGITQNGRGKTVGTFTKKLKSIRASDDVVAIALDAEPVLSGDPDFPAGAGDASVVRDTETGLVYFD